MIKKNFKELNVMDIAEAAIYYLYRESAEGEDVTVEIEVPEEVNSVRAFHIYTDDRAYGINDEGTITVDHNGHALLIEVSEDKSLADGVKAVYIPNNHYIYYFN